ncbi:MAG: hypothetical protein ABI425_02440 [Patescibacteria group bacterium]
MSRFGHWKYKNLTFLLISLLIAFFVLRNETLHSFLMHLGNLGYIGAFFAGLLFVSTFTVATGAIILLVLAETLSPIELGLIAGFGAVLGDFVIFRFVKDDLTTEIKLLYNIFDRKHQFKKVLRTKYFSWSLPVVGALIIASPLPDELGVSLMGISKLKTYQFVLLSFVLNMVGIFLVTSSSFIFKP